MGVVRGGEMARTPYNNSRKGRERKLKSWRRLLIGVVIGLIILGVGLVAISMVASTAYATNYDNRILDEARLFDELERSKIEEAIRSISDKVGADTFVMTFTDIGNSENMDLFLEEIEKKTEAWQSPGGGRKSNLLVLAVSMDRWACIYYGESWKSALERNGDADRIRTDYMQTEFKAEAYANGFIRAIGETERVLDAYLRPPVQQQDVQPVVIAEPVTPKEPINWAPILSFLGFLVAAAIAIFVAYKLLRYFYEKVVERKRLEDERLAAREQAMSKRDATTRITNRLDESTFLPTLKAKVKTLASADSSRELELWRLLTEFERLRRASADAMQSAASAANDAEDADLTTGVYRVMEQGYAEAYELAIAARNAAEQIEEIGAKIDEEIASVPALVKERGALLDEVSERMSQMAAANIKLPEALDAVASVAAAAKRLLVSHTVRCAREIKDMIDQLNVADQILDALEEKLRKLDTEIPYAEDRIGRTEVDMASALSTLDEFVAGFAAKSWEDVGDSATLANRKTVSAWERLQKAKELYDRKGYDEALKALGSANQELDGADSLLIAVMEKRQRLLHNKSEAPKAFELIEGKLRFAAEYIEGHADDLSPSDYRQELDAAQGDLESARSEYRATKPDYLAVMEMAKRAEGRVDSVIATAKEKFQRAEREREKAAEELQKAQREYDSAYSYIRRNSSDVGSSAKSTLRQAESELSRANGADMRNVALILAIARSANDASSRAMSVARRDVRDEEERRAEIRRRQEEEDRRRRQEEEDRRRQQNDSNPGGGGSSSGTWGGGGGGGSSSGQW